MDRVLCIMQFCVIFFLAAMLLFFAVQGDSLKLQAICTLGMLVFYKLLPSKCDRFQPSLLEGMQTVNIFVDGPTDYEVFSQPDLTLLSVEVPMYHSSFCVQLCRLTLCLLDAFVLSELTSTYTLDHEPGLSKIPCEENTL
jgi:hypothetical protein